MRWISAAVAAAMIGSGSAAAQTSADPAVPPSALAFGTALALQGDLLFAGRPSAIAGFPMPSPAPGSVHLFSRSTGGWTEVSALRAREGTVGDAFGSALAVQGTRLVVGAPGAGEGQGAVYVFERRGTAWSQTARLVAPAAAAGDLLGSAVAVHGGWLVAGAPGREGGRGTAYAWRLIGAEWQLAATMAPARDSAAAFGMAVVMDARRVVVGAPGAGGGGLFGPSSATQPGTVHAWTVEGAGLREAGVIATSDSAIRALGTSVLLDEDMVWVGAPRSGPRGVGAILGFRRDGDRWREVTRIAPSGGNQMGAGATLLRSGTDLLVGAPGARSGSGTVLVYRPGAGGAWTEAQRLEARTVGLAGQLGHAMVGAGEVLVVGAPLSEFFAGIAFVFVREGGEWKDRGSVADDDPGLPAITGTERRCETGRIDIFACRNVDILAFLPTRALGAQRGIMLNDIWGWTDPDTRREYALVGRMDGTAFVDITNPSSPVYLGDLPLTEGAQPNLWRDIKVYRNHAFIVSDGAGPHGVQVFDLTRLRNVSAPPVRFGADTVYRGIFSAHNIVINEDAGFAFGVGNSMGGETCGGALHMIDIRDPRRPTFAGCYADRATGNQRTGYTHDAQCVSYHGPDQRYRGREICFNASETAVGIGDVTDKASPKPLGRASHPNTAYTHQGWLSEDHRYFFVNDEGDELAGTVPRTRTIVYDVADLEDPVVLTEYLGETRASDHNLYVRGRYMFESNYVSGLRVIDIADPAHPREVGFLDTVPFGEDQPGFAGSWSNYPYFPSGTIVVSSMREGLFIVRHRPEAPPVP